MLVTDTSRRPQLETTGDAWLDDVVREAVLGGVTMVQLREKHLSPVELVALGLHVRDAIARRVLFFVNSDVDAAITLAADGIHLPEAASTVRDVRGRVGDEMLISRSVHSVDAAVRAERDGADMLVAGTLFETESKPGTTILGTDGLRDICAAVELPVLAIGGINAENAAQALSAGAMGVAVVGAIADAGHPREAAAALRVAIDAAGMRGVA
jgi:thiamine-phosphate pyrophosphorylase